MSEIARLVGDTAKADNYSVRISDFFSLETRLI